MYHDVTFLLGVGAAAGLFSLNGRFAFATSTFSPLLCRLSGCDGKDWSESNWQARVDRARKLASADGADPGSLFGAHSFGMLRKAPHSFSLSYFDMHFSCPGSSFSFLLAYHCCTRPRC